MKPLTKFLLILCAVLTVLGFAGIGTSMAMGIKPSQLLDLAHVPWMTESHRMKITEDLDSIPPVKSGLPDTEPDALEPKLPDMDSSLTDSMSGNNPEGAEEYYEFHNIDSLNFDFNVCTLDIQSHESDYIALGAWNVSNTFQCWQEKETLFLKDERTYLKSKEVQDYALRLTLYVPKQPFEDIDITVNAGNITIDELSAKNMEIEGGAGAFLASTLSGDNMDIDIGTGELTAGALSGKNITLDIGVGNLNADTISVTKNCSIDSGTGNVSLNQYNGKNLDIDCGAGNVSVLASGKEHHYNYKLDCGVGDIRINHELHTEDHHHTEHEGMGCHMDVQNSADQDIYIDCGLGGLELNFTEEDL